MSHPYLNKDDRDNVGNFVGLDDSYVDKILSDLLDFIFWEITITIWM